MVTPTSDPESSLTASSKEFFKRLVSAARSQRLSESSDPSDASGFPRSFSRSVDVSRMDLVSPGPHADVAVATRHGVPNATEVVVMLLFIGACGRLCEDVLNKFKTWFNRANMLRDHHGNKNQLEIILVSAHKRMEDFAAMVRDFTNPFFAVPYESELHAKLMEDFGVSYDDSADFKPRVAVLEWLGARNYADSPVPPARECTAIRHPIGFLEDLALEPLVDAIDVTKETRPLLNEDLTRANQPPVDYDDKNYYSNNPKFPPIERVQRVREHCSYYFNEVRDSLYDLRGDLPHQSKFILALYTIANRVCDARPPATEKAAAQYNEAVDRIFRYTRNNRMLKLLGATALRDPSETGRIGFAAHPVLNWEYFQYFFARLYSSFDKFSKREKKSETAFFPQIKFNANPELRMYCIRIYYRSQAWTAIRDTFPSSIEELRSLVSDKVMNINIGAARLFSDDLNPMETDEDMAFPDGITRLRGSLAYESLADIAGELESAPLVDGMRRIRIIALGPKQGSPVHALIPAVRPAKNKEVVLEKVTAMLNKISKLDFESPWLHEATKSAAVVMKLVEIEEFQEEILRRIPVQRLHFKAANMVNSIRSAQASGPSVMPPPPPPEATARTGTSLDKPSFLQSGTPPELRASWPPAPLRPMPVKEDAGPDYDEELLKALIEWFSTAFFSWLPSMLECQTTKSCPGVMVHMAAKAIKNHPTDVFGNEIEHDLLKAYIVEKFMCTKCHGDYRIYRPIHDVGRMLEFTQGRCGEFSKAFALAARAMGFETRIVAGRVRFHGGLAASAAEAGDTDHFWNEVYLENRREWVQVDTSASDDGRTDAGAVVIGRQFRFNRFDVFEHTKTRLLMAAAISKDDAYIVTKKYLLTPDEVAYADYRYADAQSIVDIDRVSFILRATDINENPESLAEARSLRTVFSRHMKGYDSVRMENKFKDRIQPKYGKGFVAAHGEPAIAPGPCNVDISIHGDVIPEFDTRPMDTMFQTYSSIMRFDCLPKWFVCEYEVYTVDGLVANIRFGYCDRPQIDPKDNVPYVWGSAFMPDYEGRYPVVHESQLTHHSKIAYGDFIAFVAIHMDEVTGLLTQFEPALASELGMLGRTDIFPVVGFYGTFKDPGRVGIDSIGIYRLKTA